jgi:hypothetical protein
VIPAALSAGLVGFKAAIAAAKPINQAPALQVAALVRQGNALLVAIDAAIEASGTALDADAPSGHPLAIVAAVNALVEAGSDHSTLHDVRGFVGRAVFNLAQGYA